jgi:hypothetical protein
LPRTVSFFKNGAASFLLLLALDKFKLFYALSLPFSSEFWNGSITDGGFEIGFLFFAAGVSAISSIVATWGEPQSKPSRYYGRRSRKEDCRPWWMWPLCPSATVVFFFPALLAISFFIVFFYSAMEFSNMSDEIFQLNAWPTNTTCPQLWSDPLSSWVWMLA